jgi:hypothetical protein
MSTRMLKRTQPAKEGDVQGISPLQHGGKRMSGFAFSRIIQIKNIPALLSLCLYVFRRKVIIDAALVPCIINLF